MSHPADEALETFAEVAGYAADLIGVSEKSQDGRGRRFATPSLHRGAVVLTVAGWQAFAEDLVDRLTSYLAVPSSDPAYANYLLIRASAQNAIGRLNTANSHNVSQLFRTVGMVPTWGTHEPEIDAWLAVRHKVAHGDKLPAHSHGKAVASGNATSGPTLWRTDTERCLTFFRGVAQHVAQDARAQFP